MEINRAAAQAGAAAPSPGVFPTLSHFMRLLKSPLDGLNQARAEYGDIVQFRLGPFLRVLQINHPGMIEHVLVRNPRNYRKIRLYKWVDLAFGKGIFTSEGELWVRQRRLLQPHFTRTGVHAFSGEINRAIAIKLAELEGHAGRRAVIDIEEQMVDCTRRILIDAIVEDDIRAEVDAVREEFIRSVSPSPVFGRLPIPGRVSRLRKAVRVLRRRLADIILERRQRSARTDDSLLTRLIQRDSPESRSGLGNRQLLDEALTLIFTGDETSAQSLTWTWHLLSQNPDVEARFHAELDAVLHGKAPDADSLPALRYTYSIVQESMRLFPPAWANARVAQAEDRVAGYRIPAGSIVMYSQYVMHRHPVFWDDPEKFKPERFLKAQGRADTGFYYFPFGGGQRNCIGSHFALLSILLILARVGQRFRFRTVPGQNIDIEPNIALRPRRGLKMYVESR